MKKIVAVIVVLICVSLAYLWFAKKEAVLSLLGKSPVQERTTARPASDDKLTPEERTKKIQKQQEKIAKNVADQQAISQRLQQNSFNATAASQRNLQTIEEINRINRLNQQMQRQSQQR